MDIKELTIENTILDFLKEKFPYHHIEFIFYGPNGPAPGDYTLPCFKINNRFIGILTNKGEFYNHTLKTINISNPDFFNILHKTTVDTLGYDPLIPGSREEFMNS